MPKIATGALAFTPDGTHVLVGFADGDVMVRSVADAKSVRVATHHRAPVDRIHVSPGGGFVFTEDRAGEQRIWPMMPP